MWRESIASDVPGLAAEVSYYALFALFPFILLVGALVGMLAPDPVAPLGRLIVVLHRFLPDDTAVLLTQFLQDLVRGPRPGVFSFVLIALLWSGSLGFVALFKALHRMHCDQGLNWLRHRTLAVATTLGASLATLMVLVVMLGPDAEGPVASRLGLTPLGSLVWGWLRWPVAYFLFSFALASIYALVPCGPRRWRWVTLGGLLAPLAWTLASAGLTMLMNRFAVYETMYGAIGGVMALLVWIYAGAYLMLMGAEINGTLSRMSEDD